MITRAQAIAATYSQEFMAVLNDGRIGRVRVNGKCKVWKTRPEDFSLPCKYGLYECFYITQENAHKFTAMKES